MKSQPVTETQEDDDIVPSEAHGFVKKEIPDDASSKRHISKKKEASAKQVRTEAIDEQLSVIYENGDGTMPDMHHFERSRGRTMRAVVVLLFSCLFLGGVAYAGFFFFQPPAQFSEDDVVLTVSGNEQVQIGESVKYRIRYKNDQSTALTNATIHVRYPDGFVFKDSSIPSTNDSHDEWKIGALEKEASGYFDIEGNVYADQGSKQSLRVFLDYRPANFSSDFQKAATAVIEVAKSPYTLAIEGDKEAVVGAEAAFTITVAPTADMEASSSTVVVSIDSSVFTKKSSQPTSDVHEPYRWTIADPSKETKITVKGSFAAQADNAPGILTVQLLAAKPGDTFRNEYVMTSAAHNVTLAKADLSALLAVNGATSELSIVPGETLSASIAIANNGQSVYKKVRVRAIVDSPSIQKKSLVDWTTLEDIADGTVVGEQVNDTTRRGVITWDAKQKSDFTQLDPGEAVTLDFSVALKKNDKEDLSAYPNQPITIMVDVQYDSAGTTEVFSGNRIVFTLNSDASFDVRDVVTGQTHAVTWLLSNSLHPLKDVRFEADLYGDITVDTKAFNTPAGTATYDERSKKIVWSIPEMPTSLDVLAFQFPVMLNKSNPSQSQLASKVKGRAIDTVTGRELLFSGDEILLKSP